MAFARVRLGPGGRPGAIETIAARDDAELDSFALTDDRATAALFWNVAGRTELQFLDLATLRATPGPALPAEVSGGGEFSKDGKLMTLTASGASAPGDVWVLERASGRFRRSRAARIPEWIWASWCDRSWWSSPRTMASS